MNCIDCGSPERAVGRIRCVSCADRFQQKQKEKEPNEKTPHKSFNVLMAEWAKKKLRADDGN